MQKKGKSIAIYFAVVAALILITVYAMNLITAPAKGTRYSEVFGLFQNNQVTKFDLDLGNGTLEYYTISEPDEKQTY